MNNLYGTVINKIVYNYPKPIDFTLNLGTVDERLHRGFLGLSSWEVVEDFSYKVAVDKMHYLQKICDFLELTLSFEQVYKPYDKYRTIAGGKYKTVSRKYELIGKIYSEDISKCLIKLQQGTKQSGNAFYQKIKNSTTIHCLLEDIWNSFILEQVSSGKNCEIYISDVGIADEPYGDGGWTKHVSYSTYGYKPLCGTSERNGLFLCVLDYINNKLSEVDSIKSFEWIPKDSIEKYYSNDRINTFYLNFIYKDTNFLNKKNQ